MNTNSNLDLETVRDMYRPKSGIEQVVRNKLGTIEMHLACVGDAYHVVGFVGRKQRPSVNHSFKDKAGRDSWAESWFNKVNGGEAALAERRAKEKADRAAGAVAFAKEIKVGDVFVHSWGYSMSLNDFYQVISIEGKKIKVLEIAGEYVTGGGYSGQERPKCLSAEEIREAADFGAGLDATVYGDKCIRIRGVKIHDSVVVSLTSPEKTHSYNTMD